MGEVEDEDAGAFDRFFEGWCGDEVGWEGNVRKVFDVLMLEQTSVWHC